MLKEYYGLMINIIVKLFTAILSSLDITLTEFWFKFPIAIIGALQIPLTYLFLRKLRCDFLLSSLGSGIISFLPIHVMLSRYLWGYDIIGLFFLTFTLIALVTFLSSGLKTSSFLFAITFSFYLVSHGYIVPSFPMLLFGFWLLGAQDLYHSFKDFKSNFRLLLSHKYWVIPIIILPLTIPAIYHALQKKTRLGLYFIYHFKDFLGNTGIGITLMIFSAIVLLFFLRRKEFLNGVFLFLSGIFYLSPIFLGAPPGITVARDYMLVGTFLLILLAIYVYDKLHIKKFLKISIFTIILITTLLGTVSAIFFHEKGFLAMFVTVGRGGIEDFGIKSAGYIIQKYVPLSEKVLAIHRNIEPENLFYYFKRKEFAFYDLTLSESIGIFYRYKEKADILICDEEQVERIGADNNFLVKVILYDKMMKPKLWIFVKKEKGNILPFIKASVDHFNSNFDKEFSWKVRFW
jgi:hypothetical protein